MPLFPFFFSCRSRRPIAAAFCASSITTRSLNSLLTYRIEKNWKGRGRERQRDKLDVSRPVLRWNGISARGTRFSHKMFAEGTGEKIDNRACTRARGMKGELRLLLRATIGNSRASAGRCIKHVKTNRKNKRKRGAREERRGKRSLGFYAARSVYWVVVRRGNYDAIKSTRSAREIHYKSVEKEENEEREKEKERRRENTCNSLDRSQAR